MDPCALNRQTTLVPPPAVRTSRSANGPKPLGCEVGCEVLPAPVRRHVTFNFDDMPDEVALSSAPLVRVLCQVRYSSTPELVDDHNEQRIASLLVDLFPVRGSVDGVMFIPGLNATPQQDRMRTFEDIDGAWRASVTPNFLALETTAYDRRTGFLDRLAKVLAAVHEVGGPPRVTRIGLRYTDRIEDPAGLRDLVRPALLGMVAEVDDDDLVENQIQQALLIDSATQAKVQVRSLCLPPGVGFDPSINPVERRSWVLDIDAYTESPRRWDPAELSPVAELLAKRAYQVFHWAVTDTFRQTYS